MSIIYSASLLIVLIHNEHNIATFVAGSKPSVTDVNFDKFNVTGDDVLLRSKSAEIACQALFDRHFFFLYGTYCLGSLFSLFFFFSFSFFSFCFLPFVVNKVVYIYT